MCRAKRLKIKCGRAKSLHGQSVISTELNMYRCSVRATSHGKITVRKFWPFQQSWRHPYYCDGSKDKHSRYSCCGWGVEIDLGCSEGCRDRSDFKSGILNMFNFFNTLCVAFTLEKTSLQPVESDVYPIRKRGSINTEGIPKSEDIKLSWLTRKTDGS